MDAFQITGLYFQHSTRLELGIGEMLVRSGVERYPFNGVVSFLINHESSMVDSLGPSILSAFWQKDGGWGFTKQYTNPKTHKHLIHYRFTELSIYGAYWIGEYRLENGSAWGEAHAILAPITLDVADKLLARQKTTTAKVILDETMRMLESSPKSILHLSRLPQVFDHGDNGVLPPIERQDPDVRALCESALFENHTASEGWVEVYCFIANMASRLKCEWNDVVNQARSRVEEEGSLLNALKSIHAELDSKSRQEQYATGEYPEDSDE
jgi:hypothetical protein